jgi:YVTN family beta-propeller protein
MRARLFTGLAMTAALIVGAGTAGAEYGVRHAGPQGDGSSVTPVGWLVTPAGAQSSLGSLPTASALSPDGKLLLVLNAGDSSIESIQVVDTATHQVTQTIDYTTPSGVYAGVAFSPDGTHAYASGGGSEKIHVYTVADGKLTEGTPIQLPTTNPSGQAINAYAAGLAVTPDGKRLVVADEMADAASVIDLTTGQIQTVGVGHNPYGVAISPDGHTAYVSNQGADTVTALDLSGATPTVSGTVTVGAHPNRLVVDPRTGTLYVADSESDAVSVVSSSGGVGTISLAPYPGAPVGANPDGLTLSSDGRTLYVVNSGDNDVAVVDVASSHVRGLIPTAWYPTSVALAGGTLLVTNGKGLGAGPNPNGPNPYTDNTLRGNPVTEIQWEKQYVGTMMLGTLSSINVPDWGSLARYTAQVDSNDQFYQGGGVRAAVATNPVPARVGASSPIKHVIYVVRENRTYDQEFGSLGKGNGDPSLNLFGNDSAPNSRALESSFVTLDNTYAAADVSAQGWNWSVQANSNPYVEQTWVGNYSGRNHPYDYEGSNTGAASANANPLDSYIWDKLADKGVSFRNYGFYETDNKLNTTPSAADPRLAANTDPNYYGWDLKCPDSAGTFTPLMTCNPRYNEWNREFQQYVANNNLPSVEFVRFGNDHTQGTNAGVPTPAAYVADNDYALGQLVDTVSHSKYWSSTAIFVVEDDAQAGPDHVDAHRMTAEVISPYTQYGKVDSTFYSTASVLRTIELLTGIAPMTQFDASAIPMFNAFNSRPNLAPYNAIKPAESILTQVNPSNAPLASVMAKQNFSREDMVPEQLLNTSIWESVKGASSALPAPQHHVFAATGTSGGDN